MVGLELIVAFTVAGQTKTVLVMVVVVQHHINVPVHPAGRESFAPAKNVLLDKQEMVLNNVPPAVHVTMELVCVTVYQKTIAGWVKHVNFVRARGKLRKVLIVPLMVYVISIH